MVFYVRNIRLVLWEVHKLSVEDLATQHQQGGKSYTDRSPREQKHASNKGKTVASDLSDWRKHDSKAEHTQ